MRHELVLLELRGRLCDRLAKIPAVLSYTEQPVRGVGLSVYPKVLKARLEHHLHSVGGTRFIWSMSVLKGDSDREGRSQTGSRGLESQVKEAASTRGLGGAIHMQQLADPVDVTQEAAERDVAVQTLFKK